jgi:hypothetical protein
LNYKWRIAALPEYINTAFRTVKMVYKAFKIFRRELIFKQIELEEEIQSNEQELDKAQKQTEREVDKVRVDLTRSLKSRKPDIRRRKFPIINN